MRPEFQTAVVLEGFLPAVTKPWMGFLVEGDPARWIAREKARHREFDFTPSAVPGPIVNVSRKLDVGRGVAAGELRRRILNFAATVAKMPRT